MRILHLVSSEKWTGAAVPAVQLAEAQMHAGHAVQIVLQPGRSLEEQARALGLPVAPGTAFHHTLSPLAQLRDSRALRAAIGAFKPDAVHSHLTHDHLVGAWALRGTGIPLVRTLHRLGRGDTGKGWLLRRATDAVAVASTEMAGEIHRRYGLDPARIAVLGTTIDLSRFRRRPDLRAALRAKWGIAPDAPVAGIVSRIRPARGFPWLLDAAADFLARNPDARLVICGTGSWKKDFLALVAAHPRRSQIVYAGYASGEELEGAYNAFDVSLLLKPGNDSFCRAAIEALACETPLVGGDFGVVRDLLRGSDAGWLVPLDDAKALADAVDAALADLPATRARGPAGRALVAERFSESRLAEESAGLYRRAANAH